MSDGASFETERLRDDQPPRDDLIDPEDIDTEEPVEGTDEGVIPDTEELPESQGADVVDADRLTEDQGARTPLSDEEEA